MPNKLQANEKSNSRGRKDTHMAAMVAPTKRAPKVLPRDGITVDGCEDIAGEKEGVEWPVVTFRRLIDGAKPFTYSG